MRAPLPALVTGMIFGAGLAISDMINPARVLAFLDVFGRWDPTLAYVMGGALLPTAIGVLMSKRMTAPLFHTDFHIPENRVVDYRLALGAMLFGIGWGLVGYCPGPAVAGLVYGMWQPWLFVFAMLGGMAVHRLVTHPAEPTPCVSADA
ncbi:MAG: DUF6691 family protein [Parasphingopyxis sp.]